jgi:hypothetical protein
MISMNLIVRAAFVVGGIVLGSNAINYYVLGNTGDYLVGDSDRMGNWRKAQIRPRCYPHQEAAARDPSMPKKPSGEHHIGYLDFDQTRLKTASLYCYVVIYPDAVCEPNNRAYIVNHIRKYYETRDDMLSRAERYGKQDVENVRQLWSSPYNHAIEAALASHIRNGRLKMSDFGWFGWFAPDAVVPLLRQAGTVADTCPKTTTAPGAPRPA